MWVDGTTICGRNDRELWQSGKYKQPNQINNFDLQKMMQNLDYMRITNISILHMLIDLKSTFQSKGNYYFNQIIIHDLNMKMT